jgi:hypothetical protein
MAKGKGKKPEMRNLGVGHLKQSIKSMRIILATLEARIDKTEKMVEHLETVGHFEAPEDVRNKTRKYFYKFMACFCDTRKISDYESFDSVVMKMGVPNLQDMAEHYIGKKLSYPEMDEMAKDYFDLGTTD